MAEREREEKFQTKVLQELERQEPGSRRAMQTELAALLRFMSCTGGMISDAEGVLTLSSPRPQVWKKCFTLLEKTYNIDGEYAQGRDFLETEDAPAGGDKKMSFCGESAERMRAMMNPPRRFEQDEKCVRSYLVGAFLCVGVIHDPEREYSLSFESRDDRQALEIIGLLSGLGIQLRQQAHGRGHSVLTRDSAVIVDILKVLGAYVSMMEMENARIVRQVRSRVNRKVNCETANIMKTVAASQKQLEEIQLLRTSSIWDTLPESLQQMALLREQYPDSSLQELGERMNPPVGKSGVNHRLRRLSVLARSLQEQ